MEKFKGFYVQKNANDEDDIEFSVQEPSQEIPKNYNELFSEVEKLRADIIKIFEKDKIGKEKYFQMLLTLAQAGLAGENSNPDLGLIALKSLKNDILTVEGQKFKTKYMISLGKNAAINAVITLVLFFAMSNFFKFSTIKYLLVFSGAMIGSWISFGIRKLDISFKDLVNFEKDLMPCQIRLIFIGIVSVIFAMLVNNNLIDISVSNFKLSTLFLKSETTLLFGILCGILDKNLAINLYEKSHNILNISSKGE
ncbi:hypothetical protein [Cetobacterium sp.]|uniref:hypothetical protein n=1 Tax=Cetobacterium sp. TaxID=2071632 RepID=UPI003F31CC55